jgi:two-component system chemotaxis sensor kinase CheA
VLYRGTATLRGAAACLGQESLAALADELTLAVDKCRDGRRQARELCARSRSNDMVARETPFASVIETCQELLQGDSSETILTTLHRDLEGLCDTSARMRETAIAEAATTFLQSIGAFRENRQQQMRHSRSSSAARSPHDGRTPEQRGSEPIAAPGPVAAPVHASSPVAASRGERTTPSPTCAAAAKTMRVDQGKLDDYINLAGELVIARNALVHEFRQSRFDGAHHHGLKESVERVQRIVADIQANAMSMRMVPVMTVFQRFPRMVRDIAKTQDKQIEVQIFGEDTELDKQVAEKLGDPLVHLIRNSADHGIELPGARRAAGKSESGLITLRAGREGSAIVIDILDDGRGIDVSRLRAKAVEKGILRQEQADAMPREKALELIFAAGLSTAKSVSDLSGRGVGMDVVRNNITDLGGTVSVFSEENQGTQIRLQLPLTLAVTTVVLVSSHDGLYAVPMESVQETVKVAPRDIRTLNGQCAISLRGAIVPVLSLAEVLSSCTTKHIHHRQDVAPLARDRSGRVPIVVVATASTCFGIAVDELKGQQEIVIKPLPSQLGQLPGVAGATIMGDGSVVLILDPASIYALVTRGIDPGTAAVHPLARCSARTETKA